MLYSHCLDFHVREYLLLIFNKLVSLNKTVVLILASLLITEEIFYLFSVLGKSKGGKSAVVREKGNRISSKSIAALVLNECHAG